MTRVLPVELALRLVDSGLRFVVVGSTATWLGGGARAPHDLDVVVDPDDLPLLRDALAGVALSGPPLRRPAARRVDTTYGPLDLFFHRLRGGVVPARMHGGLLRVSSG